MTRRLEVVVYREDDGYTALCLNLNFASEGDTEAEAVSNLREVLKVYLENEDEDQLQITEATQAKLIDLTL